jgi:hypothetical protein
VTRPLFGKDCSLLKARAFGLLVLLFFHQRISLNLFDSSLTDSDRDWYNFLHVNEECGQLWGGCVCSVCVCTTLLSRTLKSRSNKLE